MEQEIEYYCPTAEEMSRMLERQEQWDSIDEILKGYEYSAILEWKEKAEKYDEIMAKRKKASEKSKASLMKNMTVEERKARSLKAVQARWGKKNTTNTQEGK